MQSIQACKASWAASRSSIRGSSSSSITNRSSTIRSPSRRKVIRMHGTAKGLPDSTNQGSNARDRESPSSVTQYPRTRLSPSQNREYDAAIGSSEVPPETPRSTPTGPPGHPFLGAVYVVSGPVFVSPCLRATHAEIVSSDPAPPVDEVHRAHRADRRDRDQSRRRDSTHVEPPVPEAEGHFSSAQRRLHVVPDHGS